MINEKSNRIFIVDDDPYWSELLKGILHSLGYYNVLCFESGEACLEGLEHQPGIIFLDYQMKNSNGIATLRNIKDKNEGLIVIFTTSVEDIDVAVKAMKLGSFDFFQKASVSELTVKNFLCNISDMQRKTEEGSSVHPSA
jgi:DNA-binding NtrC family response regulator